VPGEIWRDSSWQSIAVSVAMSSAASCVSEDDEDEYIRQVAEVLAIRGRQMAPATSPPIVSVSIVNNYACFGGQH